MALNTSGLDRERKKRYKESYEFWKQVNLQKKLKCIKCEKVKSVNDFYLLPKKRQRFIENNIIIYLTSCKQGKTNTNCDKLFYHLNSASIAPSQPNEK